MSHNIRVMLWLWARNHHSVAHRPKTDVTQALSRMEAVLQIEHDSVLAEDMRMQVAAEIFPRLHA